MKTERPSAATSSRSPSAEANTAALSGATAAGRIRVVVVVVVVVAVIAVEPELVEAVTTSPSEHRISPGAQEVQMPKLSSRHGPLVPERHSQGDGDGQRRLRLPIC